MTVRVRHLAATAAVSLAAVLLVPAGASASSAGSLTAARRALTGLRVAAPNQPVASGAAHVAATTSLNSRNWSGWADDSSAADTYTAVKGRWKVPTVRCIRSTDTELAAFWVGIDGFSSNSVEQDGTLALCVGGLAEYFSWWEMYPTNAVQLVAAVNPGDVITSKVTFKTGKYHLVVTDATTPSGSFSEVRKCGPSVVCANSSAEWIAERPSNGSSLLVLPQFTTWKVTGASATAATTGPTSAFPDDQITMVNGATVLAQPSALTATGNGFTVAWKASA